MGRYARALLWIVLVFGWLQPVGVQAAPSAPTGPTGITTTAPAGYYDGQIQYSAITNCVSIIQGVPYLEYGAGAYVGFYANPQNGIPGTNSTYYVHVVVAGLGNSCSGQRAFIDLFLPTNTVPAVTPAAPIHCYYSGVALPLAECPQNLPGSPYNPGAYALWSTDSAHANTWPIPVGKILEIQIPVRSTATLSNSQMRADVWMLDGNSSPWLQPVQGVYVFGGTTSILYPTPSATLITATTVHNEAYLYTNSAGTFYFDLGLSNGSYPDTSSVSIPGPGSWTIYVDWSSMVANTSYHWRGRYVAGGTIYGIDQSFKTLTDGQVTVGQGLSSDCSETAFNAALPGAKEILFNCGPQPVTITLTAAHNITSAVAIRGGNQVTLAFSGTGNFFNVQSGGALTLDKITLSGGNSFSCGGAVNVASGGQLSVSDVRFTGNHSYAQGGAICNGGTTTINNTVFSANSSSSHGGAIQSHNSLTITNSRFIANTSAGNGGGIDLGSNGIVANSVFSGNIAGLRGGGVNSYVGTLTLSNSTFDHNSSSTNGGGLTSDASSSTVNATTFSNNTTSGGGGGLEMSGVGFLTLTDVTISANRATGDGGGLYRTAGAGPVMLLNTTFAANISSGQGGSLFGGAETASISLKNTLISGGSPNNCNGAVTSQGYNLESANSCGLNQAGDKVNRYARLAALLYVGSSLTATHALLAGSPAIDGGTNAGCPATDESGSARPVDGNRDSSAICDIGASESAAQIGYMYLPVVKK